MTYPFIKAAYDYGPRTRPALGLMYHMAEGGGTVGYLDDVGPPPSRGVSVHAVCEYSGLVVQMLPWSHISGSLNPADRSVDTGYYGHSALVDVLGGFWTDPNTVVLSMEIEGFAAKGPNAAQVAGAIAWGRDMTVHFPTLRGALGHTDQTDTKGCPGLTAAMKSIFTGVGGHGLWTRKADVNTTITVLPFGGTYVIPAGATPVGIKLDSHGVVVAKKEWTAKPAPSSAHYDATVVTDAVHGNPYLRCVDGFFEGYLVSTATVTETPNPAPTPDCDAAVNKALDHVAPTVAAVATAIAEARPR